MNTTGRSDDASIRILYAGTGYKPAYRLGGPIVSVSAAAERLVRKGHRVTVVATTADNDRDIDVPTGVPVDVEGVRVWYFKRREPLRRLGALLPYVSRSIGFMYAPQMRAAIDRLMSDVDVVHTQGPFVYPSYAAARAAIRHGKPLVYSQRGCFDPERLRFRGMKKRMYIRAVEKPLMERAHTLVALTDAETASYRALGVRTPIRVVPNGVDVPAPRPLAADRVSQRFGVPRDASLILFLARLHPIKGAEQLFQAFGQIRDEFPRSVLMLAGPGEWHAEPAWLSRASAERRVIVPGMLMGEDKADLLARADLFCLPSQGEGFSMAVLEALANATAVMLSPFCHFPEVEAAGAGVIVDAQVDCMVPALRRLLGNPGTLRAMGEAGRRLAVTRYSWDMITEQLLDLYRNGVVPP